MTEHIERTVNEEVALEAARRTMIRRCQLHPGWNLPVHGYAYGGRSFSGPYCGGSPETWIPPPGAEYAEAIVTPQWQERTYLLRQVTPDSC